MKIIVTESGTEGREINPFGHEPVMVILDMDSYNSIQDTPMMENPRWKQWKDAEESIKVYQIENEFEPSIGAIIGAALFGNQSYANQVERHMRDSKAIKFKPGTIHEAELLPNGKIKITG